MEKTISRTRSTLRRVLILFLSMCFTINGNALVLFADDGDSSAEAGSSTDRVSISIDQDDNEYEWRTGNEIAVYSRVIVSGNETVIDDAYAIVTIPKKYLDTSYNSSKGLKVSSATSLSKDPTVTSDSNNYYVRFDYNRLVGGQRIEIPIVFKTKNYTTPNGTKFEITSELKTDENGKAKLLATAEPRTFTNIADYNLRAKGNENVFTESLPNGLPPRYDETHTSTQLEENMTVYTSTGLQNYVSQALGRYTPTTKVKLTYKLADGVVFDKDNSSNKDWIYDEESNTITKLVEYPSASSSSFYSNWYAYFKMPGVEYGTKNMAYTATVVVLNEDGEEVEGTKLEGLNSYITINKPARQYKGSLTKSISDYNRWIINRDRDRAAECTIRFTNNGNQDFFFDNLKDYGLNSHMYFTTIKLNKPTALGDKDNLEINELWAVTNSGENIRLATNLVPGEKYVIDEANHLDKDNVYRSLYFKFPNKVELKVGESVSAIVEIKPFEHDWEQEVQGGTDWFLGGSNAFSNVSLYNFAEVEYYKSRAADTAFSKVSVGDWLRYNKYATESINSSASQTILNLGEVSTISIRPRVSGAGMQEDGSFLKNGKTVVLLPDGYEYVNDSENPTTVEYRQISGDSYKTVTTNVNPELVYDYNGTGKRALIFDVPEDAYFDVRDNQSLGDIKLTLRANSSTPEGKSDVEAYLVHDSDDGVTTESSFVDAFDIDDDGSTTDKISHTQVTLNYVPPREIVGIKKVGKTLSALSSSGCAPIDIGGDFWYGFTIINLQKTLVVKTLDFLDVLPVAGDKTIVPNQQGEYLARGSEFGASITGPVMALVDGKLVDPKEVGYTVMYSTDVPAVANLGANLTKTFSKNVSDYTKVTMIKIVMNDGTRIGPGAEIDFAAPAKGENNQQLQNGAQTYNSFAYASSFNEKATFIPDHYIEALKVVTPVARYKVTGTIYRDYNLDETLNNSELRIEGVKVGLYDADGKLVKTASTDKNGYYSFDVFDRGSYSVKLIEKPDRYSYESDIDKDSVYPALKDADATKAKVDDKEVNSDIDNTGSSQSFTLDPKHSESVVNAPLYEKVLSIDVLKKWAEVDAPVDSVEVELSAHGLAETRRLELKKSDEWKGSFSNLLKYNEEGEEIEYSLKEITSLENYKQGVVTGNQKEGFVVTNSVDWEPVKVVLGGRKSITGNGAAVADEDANRKTFKFVLKETTEGSTFETEATVSGSGDFRFEELDFSKIGKHTYDVYEVREDAEGYTYSDERYKVTVVVLPGRGRGLRTVIAATNKKGEAVELKDGIGLDFENAYEPMTEVAGQKTWNDGELESMAGYARPDSITVNLMADGKKVRSAEVTAENDWRYEFKNLPEYKDGRAIKYTVEEEAVAGYDSEINGSDISNTPKVEKELEPAELTIKKVDAAKRSTTLAGAEFTVTKQGEAEDLEGADGENEITETKVTGKDGKASFSLTSAGTYIIKETKAPAGYELNNASYTVIVKESVEMKLDEETGKFKEIHTLSFDESSNLDEGMLTVADEKIIAADDSTVRTGDDTRIPLTAGAMFGSFIALLGIAFARRRGQN